MGDPIPIDGGGCPAGYDEDWGIDDPLGKPLEDLRRIRDEIERKVRGLRITLTDNLHNQRAR